MVGYTDSLLALMLRYLVYGQILQLGYLKVAILYPSP